MKESTSHSSTPQNLGQLEYVTGLSPLVFVLLIFSVLLALIAVLLGWMYRSLIPEDQAMLTVAFFGMIPLLCGGVAVKYIWNKPSVRVHENGFIYKSSGKVQTVFWGDIKEFYEAVVQYVIQGVPATKRAYTLTVSGGHRIIMEQSIRSVSKIGERIRNETFKRQFPVSYEKLLNGQAIEFGSVTLTTNSITIKGHQVQLEEVKRIQGSDGRIIIKVNSRLRSNEIDYAKTPNAHVLFALLTKLTETKTT